MSFAVLGLTSCRECGRSLRDNEYGICNDCESRIREKEEALEKVLNDKKDKILSIFYKMDKYEQKALEEFIHKLGKEYKKQETLKQIEKLKKTLGDIDNE